MNVNLSTMLQIDVKALVQWGMLTFQTMLILQIAVKASEQ